MPPLNQSGPTVDGNGTNGIVTNGNNHGPAGNTQNGEGKPNGNNPKIDADTRSKVFSAYTSIRDLLKVHKIDLALPRLCVVGEQSTGKSSLVEQFVGFPCSLTKSGVGTRCPVSYALKRNETLTEPRVTKPALANNNELVGAISAHMEGVGAANPPFTAVPFCVEIEGPNYQDMEILDLPGFWTLTVAPNSASTPAFATPPSQSGNNLQENHAREIEKICQLYLRNPNYLIVLLLLANRDLQSATGVSIVERLCTQQDYAVTPERSPRKDWRASSLYVGTHFGAFTNNFRSTVEANENLEARDKAFGKNGYGEPLIVYTCLEGSRADPTIMNIVTYDQKAQHIRVIPETERKMVSNWRKFMQEHDKATVFNPEFEYDNGRVGISGVKRRIYNLWFRSFISLLPDLHDKLCENANALIKVSRQLHSQPTASEKQTKIVQWMRQYVASYLTQMQQLYLRPDSNYDKVRQTWEVEIKFCPILIPLFCKDWEASFKPSTLVAQLTHPNYDAFKTTLQAPMTGEAQLERLIQCWQYLVLICQSPQITIEDVTADLQGATQDATPNLSLVIQRRVSNDITAAFATSWIWLTWRIQCIICHWQRSVQAYLLEKKFPQLNQTCYTEFLARVHEAYANIITSKLLTPVSREFTLIRGHKTDFIPYYLSFRLFNALQFTKRKAPVSANETKNPLLQLAVLDDACQWNGNALSPDSRAAEISNVIYRRPYGQQWPIDFKNPAENHATAVALIQERYGLVKHLLLFDAETMLRSRLLQALSQNILRDDETRPGIQSLFETEGIIESIQKRTKLTLEALAGSYRGDDDVESNRLDNKMQLQKLKESIESTRSAIDILQQNSHHLFSEDAAVQSGKYTEFVKVSNLSVVLDLDSAINGELKDEISGADQVSESGLRDSDGPYGVYAQPAPQVDLVAAAVASGPSATSSSSVSPGPSLVPKRG